MSCGNKRNPPNAYNTMERNNTREIGAKHHGGYEGERHRGWGHSARVLFRSHPLYDFIRGPLK